MLALIASVAIIVYFLIPGALYRTTIALFIPPRNFQRSRADDVRFAVLAGIVPLGLAIFLVTKIGWTSSHPFSFPGDSALQRLVDYRIVFGAAYSERLFSADPHRFWHAFNHVIRRQARILSWYYLMLILEAICLGICSKRFWLFTREPRTRVAWLNRTGRWCAHHFADHLLVPQISEWYLLLSSAAFGPGVAERVHLDILLHEDKLYRGIVTSGSYFLDRDGSLSGIMLVNASRFDRRGYLSDREKGSQQKVDTYWKPIPGAKLYIPFREISNLNIRYESPTPEILRRIIERVLSDRGIEATVAAVIPSPPAGTGITTVDSG